MDDLVLAVPPKTRAWPNDLGSKRARTWVEQLPIVDSVEAARQIYRTLYHLNRSALQPEDRLELTGLYGDPVASVSDQLSRHLARLEFPLAGSKRKLADFLRELHVEMAYGYKTAVRELIDRRWRRRDELLPAAIERSIYHLSQVLSRSYRAYLPAPAGIWKEIHALYAYAERAGLAEMGSPGSPRRAYLKALLLGAAGPYQLAPEESAQVESIIDQCVARASLRLPDPRADRLDRFVVDLRSDGPAVWRPIESVDPAHRVLEVGSVVAFLNRAAERMRHGGSGRRSGLVVDMLDSALLQLIDRLTQFLGTPTTRRHRRIRSDRMMAVGTGFAAAHFFVSGEVGVEAPGSRIRLLRRQIEELMGDAADWETRHLADESDSYQLQNWFVRDQGPAGLALVRDGAARLHLRNGDLVVLGQERGRWDVGIVRWLKSPDAERVEMGVELLPGVPEAVTLEAFAERWPALILAGRETLRVLVGSDQILPGRVVRLVRAGKPPELWRVAETVHKSSSFVLFDLVPEVPSDLPWLN